MMRRFIHAFIIFSCFCILFCVPAYAKDYVAFTGSDVPLEEELYELATDSNAGIMLMSNYGSIYDGSFSTSVREYFADMLTKIGNTDYVVFRQSQYIYRMVYADDLEWNGSRFTATSADYYTYDTRYYTWNYGTEGSFSLTPGGAIVYSSLGPYPVLGRETNYSYGLLFVAVLFLLFTIYRAFLAPGRMRI